MPWIDRFTRQVNNQPLPSTEPLRLPRIVPSTDEKRRDTRAELEILVTAITRDGRRFQAYSRDLSQHGSAVIIWGELAVGERVSLAYRFPQITEEIVVPAVVRHSIEHRYGLEFTSDDHKHLESQLVRICRAAAGERSPNTEN
jgi:hypothetical protein